MAVGKQEYAAEGSPEPHTSQTREIDPEKGVGSQDGDKRSESTDDLSVDAQAGVRAIQATTSVWSKWHLITAYGL